MFYGKMWHVVYWFKFLTIFQFSCIHSQDLTSHMTRDNTTRDIIVKPQLTFNHAESRLTIRGFHFIPLLSVFYTALEPSSQSSSVQNRPSSNSAEVFLLQRRRFTSPEAPKDRPPDPLQHAEDHPLQLRSVFFS